MRLKFCKIASALPVYQRGPRRCWAGTVVTKLLVSEDIRQVVVMCLSSEWDLYCVSTAIFRMLPFTRLESTKSIRRYAPPKGTAGLARSWVSGRRRLPSPPANTMEINSSLLLMEKRYLKSSLKIRAYPSDGSLV